MLSTRKTIITTTQKKVLNALQGKIFTFLTTKKFSPKTDFKAPVSNKRFFSSTNFVREEPKQQKAEENTKGGEESKQENKTESDKDKEEAARAKKAALISNLAMAGILGFCVYAGYDWYINHKEDPLGSLMDLFTIKKYAEPTNEKLLPDIDDVPPPLRKPTLVIAFEDFLITSHWTPQHGWRVLKRPGLDKFLGELSQRYEIVLFSDGMQGVADMCVQKVDPSGNCAHKLFRDSLLYSGGRYIKDLDRMNRPISRIIIVDPKPESYHKHPDNAIPIKPWTGDPKDKTLFALIPVLDELSRTANTVDLRELLKNKGSKSADDFASELIKSEPAPPPQPQGSTLTSWLPWGKKKQ